MARMDCISCYYDDGPNEAKDKSAMQIAASVGAWWIGLGVTMATRERDIQFDVGNKRGQMKRKLVQAGFGLARRSKT